MRKRYKIVFTGGFFSVVLFAIGWFSVIGIPFAILFLPDMYEIVEIDGT